MSPTLLECLVALLLLWVAWQVGLILAPLLRRSAERQLDALDEASDVDPTPPVVSPEENKS